MKNKFIPSLLILNFILAQSAVAVDMSILKPASPFEPNAKIYKLRNQNPDIETKKALLSKNSIKNQYTIGMNKFMQSNVRASYRDFQILVDNVAPNDYIYINISKQMASIGFFNLSELAISKIKDEEIASLLEEDIKSFYYPNYNLTYKDQIYLAELYANMMYNDQSKEASLELSKQTSLLMESDYANYILAFGYMKSNDLKQAQKYIDSAISKNPKNLNYKKLKAEIYSMGANPKSAMKYFNEINQKSLNTIIFDKDIDSVKEYILYKSAKNDALKKYYLAYYYYDENELNKALRTLQTAVGGKKNINKDIYSLTSVVYYDLKEYEKAKNFAQKTIEIDSSDVKALNILGDCAFRDSDYNLALNYYKKACSKDGSKNSDVKLAKTYQKLSNDKKAKEIYAKILSTSSKNYEAYYQMGLLDKTREQTYIKKSLAINPNFKDGWLDLAKIEIEKDDLDTALIYLNNSKYIDENDHRYYYYYGLVLKNKGLITEAKSNFEKSVKLNPESLAKEELSI